MIIIAINRFIKIVNFHNRFDKALTEIFQFCRALVFTQEKILGSFYLETQIQVPKIPQMTLIASIKILLSLVRPYSHTIFLLSIMG